MTASKRPAPKNRANAKALLDNLKMATAIGAVGLTLAGWGVLTQVEATRAAQAPQDPFTTSANPAAAIAVLPTAQTANRGTAQAAPGIGAVAQATLPPTATPTAIPTAIPSPVPTAAPTAVAAQFKLDVVQWVQSNGGEAVAVVRDASGVLWYVWGSDVPLIEQGLSPQYPPQLVNRQGRSRSS